MCIPSRFPGDTGAAVLGASRCRPIVRASGIKQAALRLQDLVCVLWRGSRALGKR